MNGTIITAGLSYPMSGPLGMSWQRPISTATARPIFSGRTKRPAGDLDHERQHTHSLRDIARCRAHWHVMAAADFNGDGKADILWQDDNGLPAIWTMNGSNAIRYATLPNVGPTWHVMAAADFNGDGKADILWQDDNGLPAIWTMNGTKPSPMRRCQMLGQRGMSRRRQISTAMARPIFSGRTTTACRRSGP